MEWSSLIMLVVLIALMYFMMIRPQKKREKEFKEMLNALKVGDKIVTIGGVVGEITSINDTELTLKTTEDVSIVFIRDAVARVVPVDDVKEEKKK